MGRFFFGTGLNHTPPLDLAGGGAAWGVPSGDPKMRSQDLGEGAVRGGPGKGRGGSMGWARGGRGNIGRSRWADTWTSQVVTHPSTTQARR